MTTMIDLRSDTVTRPTADMRQAMADAEVGDDVYGDDPTVNAFEAATAQLLGKEAAMFVATGTQSNLCGIMAHCERGDEYLVGQEAHTFKYEAGGAAVLGSIQPQPIDMAPDGTMDLDRVAAAIKTQPSMNHFAHSKLLCLENTHNGRILPSSYVADAQALARDRGLGLHLDGARLWNAAIGGNQSPAEVAAGFDTVSVCLSKGLGAPIGSVLVGTPELIERARRWRKMLGGGMRQVGVLAAAGQHCLDHHIERLAQDHANAERLATGLSAIDGLEIDGPHTNMVFVDLGSADPMALARHLAADGITVSPAQVVRIVCHLDVSTDDIDRIVTAFGSALS